MDSKALQYVKKLGPPMTEMIVHLIISGGDCNFHHILSLFKLIQLVLMVSE